MGSSKILRVKRHTWISEFSEDTIDEDGVTAFLYLIAGRVLTVGKLPIYMSLKSAYLF